VEDEAESLRTAIERYRRLLRDVSDERLARELKKMIEEAEQRLKEIGGSSVG
jgi:poly(A) polymerase-like protein